MSSDQTPANIAYWMSQYDACMAIAKQVEGPNRYRTPTAARPVVKAYRLAASNWRRAATYAATTDPVALDMVEQHARDGAHFAAKADLKRAAYDGTPAPASPTAYPAEEETVAEDAPETVGIEVARKNLGSIADRVQNGGGEIVLTRNGNPVAMLVQIPEPPTGREFMGQLAGELAALNPRMYWDEDSASPHLVIAVGPDAWLCVSRDAYGLVSIEEAADERAVMTSMPHAWGLETVAQAAEAVRAQVRKTTTTSKEPTVPTITMQDMRDQITRSITGGSEGIDVEAVAEEIRDRYGVVNIDTIGGEEYWAIVRRHDATQQATTITYECNDDEIPQAPTERIVVTRDGDEVREVFTSGKDVISDGVAYSGDNAGEYLRRRDQELTGDGFRKV